MHSRGHMRLVRTIRSLAWLVSLVAIYLSLFGVGSENWPITAVGVGLIMVAVAGRITARVLPRPRMWVHGTATVTDVSPPPVESRYGRCELHALIDVPGLPAAQVLVRDRVPVAKWPFPGAVLPIRVAASDVHRVQVMWSEVVDAYDPSPSYGSSS